MFEFDQYDKRHHSEPLAAAAVAGLTDRDIDKMSLLFWGEHCTECAAPGCYKTCDLFDPRPDNRCRRFRYGIYKNREISSLRGHGAEIFFKKWGRIVTTGNTAMEPMNRLIWKERLIPVAARLIRLLAPLGYLIRRDDSLRWPNLKFMDRLCLMLHRWNKGNTKPDAFVLEVYNPGNEAVRMQLVMDYVPEARAKIGPDAEFRHRLRTTVQLEKGYSRHEFERRLFESFTETGLPFNISITPEADKSARLVFLTADFVTYASKPAGKSAPAVKCVVWDLDNTLWEGTLIETDDVRLKPGIRSLLQTLDERGILLSVASKNNHDAACRRLESFGISDYFLFPQINWQPKSENLKTIAKRLNIGLDAIAFIDDNPFELNEVGMALPQVYCVDALKIEELRLGARFQGSQTADARNRRRYYQDAIVREEKQAEFGDDYLKFLRYCEIRLEIERYADAGFDRVAELAQRTNQLNFSGKKYDRNQLHEVASDARLEKYVLSCSDKFGSYGVVGFGIVSHDEDEIVVQDLMLSCRVQGKMIEDAFFHHIETRHNPRRARRLRVRFQKTGRNEPARQVLEATQFQEDAEAGGYTRDVQSSGGLEVVHVNCAACSVGSVLIPTDALVAKRN